MRPSLKPHLGRAHLTFVSRVHHEKHTAGRVSAVPPILKHSNTGTLALPMFVVLALLSSTHGDDFQTRDSAPVKATKTEVAIDNFSFSPRTLTLSVDATVTWINHDNAPHVVSSAGNQFKKSTVLKTGQTFSHTFMATGTYSYFCSIHPRMTGKIIVK